MCSNDQCQTCRILDTTGKQAEVYDFPVKTLSHVKCTSRFLVYLILVPCGRYLVEKTNRRLKDEISDLMCFRVHMQKCPNCKSKAPKLFVLEHGIHVNHDQRLRYYKARFTWAWNCWKELNESDTSIDGKRDSSHGIDPYKMDERATEIYNAVVQSPLYVPREKRTKKQTKLLLEFLQEVLESRTNT